MGNQRVLSFGVFSSHAPPLPVSYWVRVVCTAAQIDASQRTAQYQAVIEYGFLSCRAVLSYGQNYCSKKARYISPSWAIYCIPIMRTIDWVPTGLDSLVYHSAAFQHPLYGSFILYSFHSASQTGRFLTFLTVTKTDDDIEVPSQTNGTCDVL